MQHQARTLVLAVTLLAAAALPQCDCGGAITTHHCTTMADCAAGQACIDGMCTARADAAVPDGSVVVGDMEVCVAARVCGSSCCGATELCVGGTACARDGGPCAVNADCMGDTYCDPTLLRCIPYGTPVGHDSDPMCTRLVAAGAFAPTVQCELAAPPAGDPFPDSIHVLSTPIVVDFGIGRAPDGPHRPSIIATFDDGADGSSELPTGVIRILDGATCTQQAELGSLQLTSHSSPPAVGDLDGDAIAEIVAYQAGGGLVAFKYDASTGTWTVLWHSTAADGVTPYNVTGGGWAGPSIVDLDDDGVPEILRGGIVLDAHGRLLNGASPGMDYSQGIFGVAVDVDADGQVEFVAGDGIWQWDRTAHVWTPETYVLTPQAPGHIAIADFGDFPGAMSWPPTTPEIAVISAGAARVQTLDGTIVFGPVTLPGGGTGGPPTIGDFDGDHRPELASAGASDYTVFDLDCGATPIGTCASGRTDGVLWSQRSQDMSSNVTGSSIFDFEGDGRAEAVYGDECFLRVYDGQTGDVLFSQSRSSCTWYENPVIADVDGDYNAEIVMGDNYNCGSAATGIDCSGFGLGPRNTDPIFSGLRCHDGTDCLSGNCDTGFCRCVADTDCCSGAGCADANFVCDVPPAGTPGTGNTCLAARPIGTKGLRVYQDSMDRWVRSRMVWNQHAYYVTNVNDDGTIPATHAAAPNWLDPTLNNFRQNVQGAGVPGASPDLTTSGTPLFCDATGAHLTARICNRGTEPVGSGVTVGFYAGDPASGGMRICDAASVSDLMPGTCATVDCVWPDAPMSSPGVDVYVVADDGHVAGECREDNNVTVFTNAYCGAIFG